MIIGNGTDVVRVSRFGGADKPSFGRIFTEAEQEYIRGKGEGSGQTAAGLFAAKEAVVKSLGEGFGKIRPADIEITHDDAGKPLVSLYNNARLVADMKSVGMIHVSVSHDGEYAVAFAVAENQTREG